MLLTKKEGNFEFNRYTDMAQLGRYYSLTLNDAVTRLYTSVNFLEKDNKIFMRKFFKDIGKTLNHLVKLFPKQ